MSVPAHNAILNGNLQVVGQMTGQTITTINSNITNNLNQITSVQSSFNQEKIDSKAAREQLSTDITNAVSSSTAGINQVQANLDNDVSALNASIATTNNNVTNLETTVLNNKTSLDAEIKTLNDLHVSDSTRLTNVETTLSGIDVNLQSQIDSAVNTLNINHQNVEPRVQKLEQFLIIDESVSPPVLRIKQGATLEINGNLVQN